ncbi:MAG: bifunctional precorrin-2 dehydrogenase/sirohydrochlorin ferrochelatase [Nitrososphaerales archaeon]
MIIDFKFDNKYVVIVGGGLEGYRKTLSFLDAGSRILIVSKTFSKNIKKLHLKKKIDLIKIDVKDARLFINHLNPKPDLLIAATNDRNLNAQLAKHAKEVGCMVYVVDNPSISDFIFPALAKIGDVKIAISTNGKSPLVARVLRQRIERIITKEDLLQIKLQNYARVILKQHILDQKVRRKILYKILNDDNIKTLLREGRFDEAQRITMEILERFGVKNESYKESYFS